MKVGITMLIHNKDDIQFFTEFPCFLGHTLQKCKSFFGNKYGFEFFSPITALLKEL